MQTWLWCLMACGVAADPAPAPEPAPAQKPEPTPPPPPEIGRIEAEVIAEYPPLAINSRFAIYKSGDDWHFVSHGTDDRNNMRMWKVDGPRFAAATQHSDVGYSVNVRVLDGVAWTFGRPVGDFGRFEIVRWDTAESTSVVPPEHTRMGRRSMASAVPFRAIGWQHSMNLQAYDRATDRDELDVVLFTDSGVKQYVLGPRDAYDIHPVVAAHERGFVFAIRQKSEDGSKLLVICYDNNGVELWRHTAPHQSELSDDTWVDFDGERARIVAGLQVYDATAAGITHRSFASAATGHYPITCGDRSWIVAVHRGRNRGRTGSGAVVAREVLANGELADEQVVVRHDWETIPRGVSQPRMDLTCAGERVGFAVAWPMDGHNGFVFGTFPTD